MNESALRTTRKAAGKSMGQLANDVGCHLQTIYNLEKNYANPRLDLARKIAGALGADLDTVFPVDERQGKE